MVTKCPGYIQLHLGAVGIHVAMITSMKALIIIFLSLLTVLQADVILVEDEVIHYDVPEGLLKKPSVKDDILAYFDDQKEIKLVVQLFRKKKWADWHMRGLPKTKKTFQKFFDTELGGSSGETLDELSYDEKKYELTLKWTQPGGEKLMSRMKLTSFGCVAVHIPYIEGGRADAEAALSKVSDSLEIPSSLEFKPEPMINDLMSNIGGGLVFIVISIAYLMFSLLKRSQLHQMKLERRMRQIKSAQLQRRAH